MLPTFWDSNSGETQYSLYNLCESLGIHKDVVHGLSALKDYQTCVTNTGPVVDGTQSRTLFDTKYYVYVQSLDHTSDYPEGMLSGLNTRNIAQDVYFFGTLSSSSNVLVVGESAAVLTILPNSEIAVEY